MGSPGGVSGLGFSRRTGLPTLSGVGGCSVQIVIPIHPIHSYNTPPCTEAILGHIGASTKKTVFLEDPNHAIWAFTQNGALSQVVSNVCMNPIEEEHW